MKTITLFLISLTLIIYSCGEKIIETRVCNVEILNVRKGPGIEFEKDTIKLYYSYILYVLEDTAGWIRIKTFGNRYNGWIKKDLTITENEWDTKIEKEEQLKVKQRAEHQQIIHNNKIKEYESYIDKLKEIGFIKKMNVDYNEIYVNIYDWHSVDIDEKEIFGYRIADYYDLKGSTGYVDIFDYNSGKKLAKYSKSIGYKTYE